jgi:hypothetical protein
MRISTISRPLFQLFALGFLLALALGIHQLSAWTAPTQAPPNCVGCTVPLHTGSGVQVKSGGLALSTLDVTSSMSVGGVPSAPTYLIDMDAATPGATAGIRFPDGTVQTSAGTAFDPNAPLNLGSTLSTLGDATFRSQIGFSSATSANPTYAIDMDPLPVAATNGIRFPDGTVQTSAYTATSSTQPRRFCPMVDPSKSFPTPYYIRCGTANDYFVYSMAWISGGNYVYRDAQTSGPSSVSFSTSNGARTSGGSGNCLQSLTTIANDSLNQCDL